MNEANNENSTNLKRKLDQNFENQNSKRNFPHLKQIHVMIIKGTQSQWKKLQAKNKDKKEGRR